MEFKDRLFLEYPIPKNYSIWEGNGIERKPLEDINLLIESVVDDLGSDILIDGSIEATGMVTYMPADTIVCQYAMLGSMFPFQGNRNIKVTYDSATHRAYLRFFPAIIHYKRKFRLEDLKLITGDRLIFIKAYTLWKMAERELQLLKGTNMNVDNGQFDLSVLETFRDKMYDRYKDMKQEILMYSTAN